MSEVYWVTTTPVTVLVAGAPTQVVYLRFGITTVGAQTRVNQWKNYCPLQVTLGGSVPSQAVIGVLNADDAIRDLLLHPGQLNPPNAGPAWTLSQPGTPIDWFRVPAAQLNNANVGALVQAAITATAAGGLTAGNIGNFVANMYANIAH